MEAFSSPLLLCCWCLLLVEAAVLPEQKLPTIIDSSADLAKVNQGEIGSPLRVAQCRARCLQTFANGKEDTCLQDPDCYMCWKNCELLQTNYPIWGSMCSDKRICYPGCQEACRFHHETPQQQQAEPVILTRGEEVLTLTTLPLGAGVVRWPPMSRQNVVYVLMARPAGASSWRQISQSTESEARIEAGNAVLNPGTIIRVLVVKPDGLVTIFSPAPQPNPSILLSTLSPKQQTQLVSSTALPHVDDETNEEQEPWRLQEVSLLHQRVLVIAEVAWTPRARRGVYLVTWEVDGGGLKGNLFTDSTSVTLSLWPDTTYHIQVELVSRSGEERQPPHVERSEVLILDTRKAAQVEDSAPHQQQHNGGGGAPSAEPWEHAAAAAEAARSRRRRQLTEEMLAGTGAAMLLFLIVAMAWRCHQARSQGLSKRRLLLADDSISAAGRSSPIISVMTPKDCCEPAQPTGPSVDDFLSFPSTNIKV